MVWQVMGIKMSGEIKYSLRSFKTPFRGKKSSQILTKMHHKDKAEYFGMSRIFYLSIVSSFKTYINIITYLLLTSCQRTESRESMPLALKIDGVSLVSPRAEVEAEDLHSLKNIGAGWVAIIPYGFSRANQTEVHYDSEWQWISERPKGTARMITLAHKQGLKVMLKPHVWYGQEWIGTFELTSEEDWQTWEASYREYVLAFAQIADSLGVELFCIGTEYKQAVKARPEFWAELITEVRKSYTGPLTYAANWDNYQHIPFWEKLDYIGIDAYFPLVHAANPDLATIRNGWSAEKVRLKKFSQKYRKPILFTEYGYQSVNGAAGNHWEASSEPDQQNPTLQAKAYEALYLEFWREPWFAGGFLWKWFLKNESRENYETGFTPQSKTAESVIRKWYEVD